MYEKEINLIDVSFIFHRKLDMFYEVPKCSKWILLVDGGRSHVPGYMAQLIFRLLGRWPTSQNSKMITEKAKLQGTSVGMANIPLYTTPLLYTKH